MLLANLECCRLAGYMTDMSMAAKWLCAEIDLGGRPFVYLSTFGYHLSILSDLKKLNPDKPWGFATAMTLGLSE